MSPAEGVDSAWIRSGIRSGGPGRCPPPLILNKTPTRTCWPVWPENQSFAGPPPGNTWVSAGWLAYFVFGVYIQEDTKEVWPKSSHLEQTLAEGERKNNNQKVDENTSYRSLLNLRYQKYSVP